MRADGVGRLVVRAASRGARVARFEPLRHLPPVLRPENNGTDSSLANNADAASYYVTEYERIEEPRSGSDEGGESYA